MSEIRAKTDDCKLILTSRPILTSGCKKTFTFCVVFDDTWRFNNVKYYANFFNKDSSQGYIRPLEYFFGSYSCDVPEMVLQQEGSFNVGVYACNTNNVVKTSNIISCDVVRGVPMSTIGLYTGVQEDCIHICTMVASVM